MVIDVSVSFRWCHYYSLLANAGSMLCFMDIVFAGLRLGNWIDKSCFSMVGFLIDSEQLPFTEALGNFKGQIADISHTFVIICDNNIFDFDTAAFRPRLSSSTIRPSDFIGISGRGHRWIANSSNKCCQMVCIRQGWDEDGWRVVLFMGPESSVLLASGNGKAWLETLDANLLRYYNLHRFAC